MYCAGYDGLGGIHPAIGSPGFGTDLEQVNNKTETPSNLLNMNKMLKGNTQVKGKEFTS